MGQEEIFQSNSERIFNNNKNSKNGKYIDFPKTIINLHPNKSMFEFLYVVGRGGFGKVWMVKYKKSHHKYALKEMSKVKIIDRKSEKSIKNEREFLSQLHHPFIVNMICSFQDYENLYLVMDLLTGGDLRYHLCHKKQFDEEQSRFFSSCILLGLEYIHKNSIIHRDIKPENLVLDEKGYMRITDFGVAKKNLKDNSSETSGTPGYMAPEVLCALNHSFPVDFFAIGVIIFEFMNGFRPYLGRNRKEIKEAVLAKQIHVHRKQLFENGWSFESGDLINKLLYRKPNKRLGSNGIKEIKAHPWFKNINWEELYNKNMKSPFVPKEGDNFDKKYCEGAEQIDTQTKERYQYYKSKSKFKSLFINYTFIREEDKQEYLKLYNDKNNKDIYNQKNKNTINTNFISTSSTQRDLGNNTIKKNINSKKLIGNISSNNNMEVPLNKRRNANSMTNIHSFSIINEPKENKNKKKISNNRNNKYFYQYENEKIDDELKIDEEIERNKKLFYSTFKISNRINNNKFYSDNINENEIKGDYTINLDYNNNNKNDELKMFFNNKEEAKLNNKNNNLSFYTKDKAFRSNSTLNKRKNDYFYSKKITNQINDSSNKYYNLNNENNNKNYTSIKININAPININKYKYNRSSSQKNIFYDTKGIKNNSGKIIKYISIDEEMDKSHLKLNQEQKNYNNNSRNQKNRNKNNSNKNSNIYLNPSQLINFPSYKNNNISINLSNTMKRNNSSKSPINSGIINKTKNEYLLYKTSRYYNERSKNKNNDNFLYFENGNNKINNINNNNININFNINNINNNINNYNQISRDNFNSTNMINNKRNNSSRIKEPNNITSYHYNYQRKYNYNNNFNNIFEINSFLYEDLSNKIKNNEYKNEDYNISQLSKKYKEIKVNNNKNKSISKASSMKYINNINYIEKYVDQKEKNKQKKSTNNNYYYNFEILSPGINNENIMNNNFLVEDNCCKNSNYKDNLLFRKQKTQQLLNSKQNNIISNNLQNKNKYLIF